MKKLIALYRSPIDADAFTAHYRDVHLPLVLKLPGLLKIDLTRIERTLIGNPENFFLVVMYFEDADSLRTALKSKENEAAGADAGVFAAGLVTVMTGDTFKF